MILKFKSQEAGAHFCAVALINVSKMYDEPTRAKKLQ